MVFVKKEIFRYTRRPAFYISVGVILFCFFFEHRDYFSLWLSGFEMYSYLDVYYLYLSPFEYGLFFYFMPLAAIPPAALTVINDFHSGNMRMRLHRTKELKYAVQKLCSISIGSMLPTLFACVIFFLFALCVGPLEGEAGISWRNEALGGTMEYLAQTCYGLPYIAEVSIRAIITTWLWGLIGTFLALIIMKKGKTLIYGFIMFWGLDSICYYINLHDWRPFLLFYTNASYKGNLLWRYVQNGLLVFFFLCVDVILIKHRSKTHL